MSYSVWLKDTSTGSVRLSMVQLSHWRLAEMTGEAKWKIVWSASLHVGAHEHDMHYAMHACNLIINYALLQ